MKLKHGWIEVKEKLLQGEQLACYAANPSPRIRTQTTIMGVEKSDQRKKIGALCDKRDFADVIKVKDFETGEYPGLSWWARCS